MSEYFPDTFELSPDTLEAYQELRSTFWNLFHEHETFIEETLIKDGRGEKNITLTLCPNEYGILISLWDFTRGNSEDYFIEGLILLVINDKEFEYGIDEEGDIIWTRDEVDLSKHGLSEADCETLSKEELAARHGEYKANRKLESSFTLPRPAEVSEIQSLQTWLQKCVPIKI